MLSMTCDRIDPIEQPSPLEWKVVKQPMTLRIDNVLLGSQRVGLENSTPTSFIETLLKQQLESSRTFCGTMAPLAASEVDRRASSGGRRKNAGTGNLE